MVVQDGGPQSATAELLHEAMLVGPLYKSGTAAHPENFQVP